MNATGIRAIGALDIGIRYAAIPCVTNVEHAVTEADIIEHVLGPTPLSLVLLGWGMPNLDITVTARVTGSPESEAVEMGRLTPRTPSLKSIAEVVELRPDNR